MNLRILVCDDSDIVRDVIKLSLQRMGFEVVEARNGAEAVELCRKNTFACVIMDVDMPVMNGIDATRQILKEKPETIIVGFTAFTNLVRDMPSAGAKEVIGKPFSMKELIKIVEKYTNSRNSSGKEAKCSPALKVEGFQL